MLCIVVRCCVPAGVCCCALLFGVVGVCCVGLGDVAAYCLLFGDVCCLLFVVCCLLFIVCCLLWVAQCVLFAV